MSINIILEKKDSKLPKKQDKTAVLLIGRFQPPTLGHAQIINAAKKAFRKYKYDCVMVCVVEGKETSKDKSVNPLSGDSRVYYLENSTYGKALRYTVVKSAFDAFIKCRELGYEPMCVVGGKFVTGEKEENRAEGYKKLLDKYFKEDDDTPIEHRAVVLERDPDDSGVKGISGSTVRAAVLADRYDDFKEMVGMDTDDLAKKLFDELKQHLVSKDAE